MKSLKKEENIVVNNNRQESAANKTHDFSGDIQSILDAKFWRRISQEVYVLKRESVTTADSSDRIQTTLLSQRKIPYITIITSKRERFVVQLSFKEKEKKNWSLFYKQEESREAEKKKLQ